MSLISESNKAQKKAITHGEGPLLIVAGAGTGKTRVITARIAWLITEKNINIDEVLALTFSDKAAGEMEERVDLMLPYGYVDLWISTFHSFCDKILKQHALDIGLSNDYKLINETEAWLLMKRNLDKFNLDYYKPLGNPNKFIHALLKHFSRCKDEGIYPEDYLSYAEDLRLNLDSNDFVKKIDLDLDWSSMSKSEKKDHFKTEIMRVEELANAYHVYQNLLLENEALDFGDLLNYTVKLFGLRPAILKKYQKQFKYILVDEFQDTNTVQYELIKLLSAPKNNLTVVGDDDQAIYAFRGASIANIMNFKNDYPEATEIVLAENYRSAQSILDTAYAFIRLNNPNRLEEKLKINKKLRANIEDKGEILHLRSQTAEDEAVAIIDKILAIKKRTDCDWLDFAILARNNSAAEYFTNYLYEAGIPYQFLAMKGLYDKPVIIDIVNYLKLLDDYHESSAVFRALNYDYLDLPPEQVIKLLHFAKRKSISLYEAVKQSAVVPGLDKTVEKKLRDFQGMVEKQTVTVKDKNPSEIVLKFLYESGYLKQMETLPEAELRLNHNYLNQFFNKMKKFENATENVTVKDFTELIELEMQAGDSGNLAFDPEVGPDMVKIMTVHNSKGLEFDYVFIPKLVDRQFPTDKRGGDINIPSALSEKVSDEKIAHLEEERRLFYVGMTRAKKGLYFTTAEDYGGSRKKKPSRFLNELNLSATQIQECKSKDFSEKIADSVASSEKNKVTLIAPPKYFSFSQMQTYEKCPLQYKFANILKVPKFGSASLSFGSSMHNTLQKFLEEYYGSGLSAQAGLFGDSDPKAKPGFKRLLELYEENWIDDWYDNKESKKQYFEKGKKLLKNFHARFTREKPQVKYLEQSFKLKIGSNIFVGRIDRVDSLPDGKALIIDYKTGKPKPEKLNAEDKRQLSFYQIAAEDCLGLRVAGLQYYFLEDDNNPYREFFAEEKDKDALKQRFLENIDAITRNDFTPKPNKNKCKYCDYKNICEHREL